MGRATQEVVHSGARGALVGVDLGEGPVAPQVEVEHLARVLRQKRPVALVQRQRPAAGLEAATSHPLTAHQAWGSTLGGSGARLSVVRPPLIQSFPSLK